MATSPKKYLIFDSPNAFKCQRDDLPYPIVYPLIIFHCIFELKKRSNNIENSQIKIALQKAKNVATNANSVNDSLKLIANKDQKNKIIIAGLSNINSFIENNFFILYPTKSPEGIGLTFIDKTDGIYPLIFYADNCELEEKGNRVQAIKAVFDTMLKLDTFDLLIKKIDNFISSNKKWDEIKEELIEIYPKINNRGNRP